MITPTRAPSLLKGNLNGDQTSSISENYENTLESLSEGSKNNPAPPLQNNVNKIQGVPSSTLTICKYPDIKFKHSKTCSFERIQKVSLANEIGVQEVPLLEKSKVDSGAWIEKSKVTTLPEISLSRIPTISLPDKNDTKAISLPDKGEIKVDTLSLESRHESAMQHEDLESITDSVSMAEKITTKAEAMQEEGKKVFVIQRKNSIRPVGTKSLLRKSRSEEKPLLKESRSDLTSQPEAVPTSDQAISVSNRTSIKAGVLLEETGVEPDPLSEDALNKTQVVSVPSNENTVKALARKRIRKIAPPKIYSLDLVRKIPSIPSYKPKFIPIFPVSHSGIYVIKIRKKKTFLYPLLHKLGLTASGNYD